MHNECKMFTMFMKKVLPEYFIDKKILDVGAGDINGNNRFLFENCDYHANDVCESPNVTVVSKTKDLEFEDNTFDTIISTECFEHDPEYEESWKKIYKMLKPDGLFIFTCASINRPEHGTLRTSPKDSYGTIANIPDMVDYYKNLTEKDLNKILPLNELFSSYDTYYNLVSRDLCFVGIKRGENEPIILQKFLAPGVFHSTEDSISDVFYSEYYNGYQFLITDSNKVYGFGRNDLGQIVNNGQHTISHPLLLDYTDVKKIDCRKYCSIIIFKDGTFEVLGGGK